MKRSDIVATSNKAVAKWASGKIGAIKGTKKQRELLAKHKKRQADRTGRS